MAKQLNHIDPNQIHLVKVDCLQASIGNLNEKEAGNESMALKVSHLSAYNLEDKRFLLGLEVVLHANENELDNLIRFRYDFHYLVDNLEKMYALNEDSKPVFKKIFVATLAGISYSTLRGIVLEKTALVKEGGVLLSVIDPSIILDSQIELV